MTALDRAGPLGTAHPTALLALAVLFAVAYAVPIVAPMRRAGR